MFLVRISNFKFCKFIGTKRIFLHKKVQYGRHFIVLGHQYGHRDVMCMVNRTGCKV